jgi:molecular chaperone GrpE
MPGPSDETAQTQADAKPEGASPEAAKPEAEVVAAPDPLAEAEERARKAEAERRDTHDRMLRVAADFENFKKRSRKEADDAEARGRRTILTAILPVLDNLERGLDAAAVAGDASGGAIAEGVRLVMKQFLGILEKLDVKPLVALGQAFDPAVHEAIQQVETADAASGTVVKELQKGYTIGGKLLRPAMVAVARAPVALAPAEPAADGGEDAPGSHGPNGGAPPEAS